MFKKNSVDSRNESDIEKFYYPYKKMSVETKRASSQLSVETR